MVRLGRGRIVTIVSDAGRIGEARLAAYSAAKAGANGFVRSIAKEAGRHGITSNAISLSTMEPPLPPDQLAAFLDSQRAKPHVRLNVMRRFGQPDDAPPIT